VPLDSIVSWLEHNGYNRSATCANQVICLRGGGGGGGVGGSVESCSGAVATSPVRFGDFVRFGESWRGSSLRCGKRAAHAVRDIGAALDLVPISERGFNWCSGQSAVLRDGGGWSRLSASRWSAMDHCQSGQRYGRSQIAMERWLAAVTKRMDTLYSIICGVMSADMRSSPPKL